MATPFVAPTIHRITHNMSKLDLIRSPLLSEAEKIPTGKLIRLGTRKRPTIERVKPSNPQILLSRPKLGLWQQTKAALKSAFPEDVTSLYSRVFCEQTR